MVELQYLEGATTTTKSNALVKVLKDQLRDKDLDIVVFSEACLNEAKDPIAVPMTTSLVPCQDATAHWLIRDISCAVQVAKAYTVINLMMKAPCTLEDPCPPNKNFVVFNTAVVFDRNGAVIAKYVNNTQKNTKYCRKFKKKLIKLLNSIDLNTIDTENIIWLRLKKTYKNHRKLTL